MNPLNIMVDRIFNLALEAKWSRDDGDFRTNTDKNIITKCMFLLFYTRISKKGTQFCGIKTLYFLGPIIYNMCVCMCT